MKNESIVLLMGNEQCHFALTDLLHVFCTSFWFVGQVDREYSTYRLSFKGPL